MSNKEQFTNEREYEQLKTNKMKELKKLLSQVEQFKSLGYESHYYQWHTKRIFELKNKMK